MIVFAGIALGAVLMARRAKARSGNRLDMAQYGAVGGIVGGLVGLFVTIGVERMF